MNRVFILLWFNTKERILKCKTRETYEQTSVPGQRSSPKAATFGQKKHRSGTRGSIQKVQRPKKNSAFKWDKWSEEGEFVISPHKLRDVARHGDERKEHVQWSGYEQSPLVFCRNGQGRRHAIHCRDTDISFMLPHFHALVAGKGAATMSEWSLTNITVALGAVHDKW